MQKTSISKALDQIEDNELGKKFLHVWFWRWVHISCWNKASFKTKREATAFCHKKLLSARSVLIHTENNSGISTFPPKNLSHSPDQFSVAPKGEYNNSW